MTKMQAEEYTGTWKWRKSTEHYNSEPNEKVVVFDRKPLSRYQNLHKWIYCDCGTLKQPSELIWHVSRIYRTQMWVQKIKLWRKNKNPPT